MIFLLDHYYEGWERHQEYCFAVKSDTLAAEELVELTSAIEFLFEDTVGVDQHLDQIKLKEILCNDYGMKDVTKEHQKDIATVLETVSWNDIFTDFYDGRELFLHIDLYEGRDSCCGPKYKELIDKWIPKEKQKEMITAFLKTTILR